MPTIKWHIEYFTSIHWIKMFSKNPKSGICASKMKTSDLIHAARAKWILRLKIGILVHFFFYFFIIRLIKIFFGFFFYNFRKWRIIAVRFRRLNFIYLLMDSDLLNWFSIDDVKIFALISKLDIHVIACIVLNFFIKSVIIFEPRQSLI